jgi:hypothetical protein
MAKKEKLEYIYLPAYTKRQLESSDDASVWSKPIPYSPVPTENHPFKLKLLPKVKKYDTVDPDGYFYPDRNDELEDVIELLEKIESKNTTKKTDSLITKLKPRAEHLNDIYRRFSSSSDAECWARLHNGQIEVFSQHAFYFAGFGNFSSFRKKQYECLDKVLEEGAGLYLNPHYMNLCNDGAPDDYNGKSFIPLTDPHFKYNGSETPSLNGKTYKLFYDHDNGARGWAILTEKQQKRSSILASDHYDNVRDEMLDVESFVKSFGLKINFKDLDRHNMDFYTQTYVPTVEDFQKAFHINAKGKRKKA